MFYKKKKTYKMKKIFLGIFTNKNWLLNKFASIMVGYDEKNKKKKRKNLDCGEVEYENKA